MSLRIGVLGAARIVPSALLEPSRHVPGVQVTAVAARDHARAARFAGKHGIARVLPSYDALLRDYDYALGGGATMDVGAYAIHMLRSLAGAEPTVVRAEAKLSSPKVDRAMKADFTFEDGRTGHMRCSLFSARLLDISARVVGDEGELRAWNPVAPQFGYGLSVRTKHGKRKERVAAATTYTRQLEAFAAAVLSGAATLTPPADSIANMRVIDAVYAKAGLPLRGQG